MKTFKKTVRTIVYVLMILILIIAAILAIAMFGRTEDGTPQMFGYTFTVVQTTSMKGTIEQYDLIVGKVLTDDMELKLEDIVTYKSQIDGVPCTKTHRITKLITDQGSMVQYETWGDNREDCPTPDESYRVRSDIVSIYRFTIPVAGKVIQTLKSKWGFIFGVVVPIVAFIVWEIVDAVRIAGKIKSENAVVDAVDGTSDDVKDAIIKEFLAKQAAEKAAAEAANAEAAEAKAEDKPEAPAADDKKE